MNLWEYRGKKVKIKTDDGQIFEGIAHEYTSALDNTPEIASICIDHTELHENEIESIEIIE